MKHRALAVVGAAGIALALSAPGVALAGTTTSGTGSILGGTQLLAPISIPINICGNAIGVLGVADASCQGVASASSAASSPASTSGSGSVGGGNQVSAPVTIPVNVCGNAIGVLGIGKASCSPQPRSHRVTPPPSSPPPPKPPKKRHPHRGHHKPPILQTQVAKQLPKGGILPITGVNLAGLGGGALGLLAAGVMGMIGGRRKI